ncbi:urease accessory protein D [Selaginella moellendorffii]|nr:urease accessory protein D [Selaginella moellendorffii]|eukprot:XP_002990307.2 urease accessory protein D [Selaginella moellendorffii]
MEMREKWTGELTVEQCCSRAAATRAYARYPLKLVLPSKVACSGIDAVWVYLVTYGGGIVSGDSISCKVSVGDHCTLVLTTQSSTKIYKAVQGKFSEQVFKALVAKDALLVMMPDPVTCFAAAKYKQIQHFFLSLDANLVLVDWFTSGRRERCEVWAFESFRSTNNVYLDGNPVFLDTMNLEQDVSLPISSRLQDFHSVAMLVIYGPRLSSIRKRIEERVGSQCEEAVRKKKHRSSTHGRLLCSFSSFGPSDAGLVVRVAAVETELIYDFLKQELAELSDLIGAPPYYGK